MNRRLIELQRHSLAAIAMLFIVALISPTGAVAAPSCEKNPNHSSCPGGGGGGGGGGKSSDLYTVEVKFWNGPLEGGEFVSVGGASGVEGSGNQKRQSIGDVDEMDLELGQLFSAMGKDQNGRDCQDNFVPGHERGEFTIGTARLSKTGNITYVTAAFWNFVVKHPELNEESNYFLVFGPDGDGWIGPIEDNDTGLNWPPTGESGDTDPSNENFLSGHFLELQVTSGPAKTTSCHRLKITLDWKIDVTKE